MILIKKDACTTWNLPNDWPDITDDDEVPHPGAGGDTLGDLLGRMLGELQDEAGDTVHQDQDHEPPEDEVLSFYYGNISTHILTQF